MRTRNTNGFTLVEILVVMIIIGLLAAISIPVFLTQRQHAYEARLKSDVKNAGTVMEGEIDTVGNYPTLLPDFISTSEGVTLTYSRKGDTFCIRGEHEAIPERAWYYDEHTMKKITQNTCDPWLDPVIEPAVSEPDDVKNDQDAPGFALAQSARLVPSQDFVAGGLGSWRKKDTLGPTGAPVMRLERYKTNSNGQAQLGKYELVGEKLSVGTRVKVVFYLRTGIENYQMSLYTNSGSVKAASMNLRGHSSWEQYSVEATLTQDWTAGHQATRWYIPQGTDLSSAWLEVSDAQLYVLN